MVCLFTLSSIRIVTSILQITILLILPKPAPVTIDQLKKPTSKPASMNPSTKKATSSKAAAAAAPPAEPVRYQNPRPPQQQSTVQQSPQPSTTSSETRGKYTAEELAASSLAAAKAIERAFAEVGLLPYEASLPPLFPSSLPQQQ